MSYHAPDGVLWPLSNLVLEGGKQKPTNVSLF